MPISFVCKPIAINIIWQTHFYIHKLIMERLDWSYFSRTELNVALHQQTHPLVKAEMHVISNVSR